ncbi:MAG: PIN domain-containing protein [Anaerolineae bacterium]|nr:PIN domain-containing protein [Anaerolineae bacterium]
MADYLLDSNVLIQHLRGHQPTTTLLTRLAMEGQLGVVAISRTEVLAGMREHEREVTLRFLNVLACYIVERHVADLAGEWLRCYRQQGVTLDIADAFIAAAARHYDLILLTYDPRHFPMPELRQYHEMPDLTTSY